MAGKKQVLPSAESVAVSSSAEEMQSGLQCVTLAAVGRQSQLPVKIRAPTPNGKWSVPLLILGSIS